MDLKPGSWVLVFKHLTKVYLYNNLHQFWPWLPRSEAGDIQIPVVQSSVPLYFVCFFPSLLSWAPCMSLFQYIKLWVSQFHLFLNLHGSSLLCIFHFYFPRDLGTHQILFHNPYTFIEISMHVLQNGQYFLILQHTICRSMGYAVKLVAVIKIYNCFPKTIFFYYKSLLLNVI